jgi:ankyrin repeat protein
MKLKHHISYLLLTIVLISISKAHANAFEDFFRAIERDDAATVIALLQRGFDPNSRDAEGQPALFLALRQPAPAVAEALWAQPRLQVDAVNAHGETPLMMAALRGNLPWMQRLLERGAPVHRSGWAPIHYAATGPEPQAVALLLERGAPVDARSPNGTTPLMMAARYGSERSVELLLRRGANLRLRNQLDLGAADFAREAGREALARQLAAAAAR